MRFGEFLVHSNTVSEQAVLRALGEQQRRRPYIPQLMVEAKCLSGGQALRLCRLADDRQMEFLEVVKQEGLVTQEQADRIYETWRRSTPKVGEILVEMGVISRATLEEKLREHGTLQRAFPADA